MAPAPTKPVARKRNRKRKRRAVSLSSSSDSSSSDEDDISPASRPSPAKKSVELSESESSDSDSSSDSSAIPSPHSLATRQTALPDRAQQYQAPSRQRLHSPPPPVTAIPSFIPSTGSAENDAKEEQALRDKFRMFWMSSVADGFKDDLEEIRKEANLSASRLSMLINSLASGADVFATSPSGDSNAINEMEVVLEGQ